MRTLARTYFPLPLCSIVFALSFIAFLAAAAPVFNNPDVYWHLAAGDWIRRWGIPTIDPWSYTVAGAPWYNLSWLWDVALSFIVQYAGIFGLYAFGAASASLVLAVLAYTLKARGTVSELYIFITLLLTWYVLLAYLYPQPWMATLLFAIIFHHYLHRSRAEPGYQVLFPLPFVMVLWANLHGGFIVGLSLIAIYMIEAQQTKQMAWLRQLAVLGVLCGFACFVNPYHVHIIDGVLRTMHSVITPYLADWHPITIGNETGITLLLLLFLCVSNLRDARAPLADRILALAWLIYALHTRRNFMIFAVLGAPYVAYSLQEFACHAQGAAFRTVTAFTADSAVNRVKYFVLALIISATCLISPVKALLVAQEKLSDDPFHVRPALAALQPFAGKLRFINDYNLGGPLIYLSGGNWLVFADGRAGTAYPEEVLADYIAISMLTPGYEKLFAAYGTKGAIVSDDSPLAQKLKASPMDWKAVYSGDTVSAYVSRK